jgi:hypothetical protein
MPPTMESADHSAAGSTAADAGTGYIEDTGHDSSDRAVLESSDESHAVN